MLINILYIFDYWKMKFQWKTFKMLRMVLRKYHKCTIENTQKDFGKCNCFYHLIRPGGFNILYVDLANDSLRE